MSEQTKYTIFADSEIGSPGLFHSGVFGRPDDLLEFAASVADPSVLEFHYKPVAWAHGHLGWNSRADAFAAGRVIELVDGKYVARGVPVEEKKEDSDRFIGLDEAHDALDAVFGVSIAHDRDDVFEDYSGPDNANAAMIARDGPALKHVLFTKTATLEEAKRVETLGDLLWQAMARGICQTKTPTLDKLENTSEPKRAPLDWNKSTPFDQFKGFTVKCNTGPMVEEAKSPLTLSSDLKACGHQIPGHFGSAYLKG